MIAFGNQVEQAIPNHTNLNLNRFMGSLLNPYLFIPFMTLPAAWRNFIAERPFAIYVKTNSVVTSGARLITSFWFNFTAALCHWSCGFIRA